MACLLLGSPSGQHSVQVASGEGVPNLSKIGQKNTFWATLGVMLAQNFGQNWSKSKLLHFWAPLPASMTSKVAFLEGVPNVSNLVQKFTFWATLGVMLPQIFGQNLSPWLLLHLWAPLPASITSKVAFLEGVPNVSNLVQKLTFWATLGVMLPQIFGPNWSKSMFLHFWASLPDKKSLRVIKLFHSLLRFRNLGCCYLCYMKFQMLNSFFLMTNHECEIR